jgi:hypothetical protein
MSGQYRKTLADLWFESPPPYGEWVSFFEMSFEQSFRLVDRMMSQAVVLDARGAEALLKDPSVPVALTFEEKGGLTAIGQGSGKWWDPRDFPMCVPPFQTTLVEVQAPGRNRLGMSERCGVLLQVQPPEPSGQRHVFGLVVPFKDGRCGFPEYSVFYKLTEEGEVAPGGCGVSGPEGESLAIAMLACSLSNCRNVRAAEQSPPAPLSRRHAERHGRPLLRYYTLDIEPMRKALRTEGRLDEVGLKRALHLCRGHFKDYREGGGLFGRHKGLYWWDANVRGSASEGVVAKDYRIKPPGAA